MKWRWRPSARPGCPGPGDRPVSPSDRRSAMMAPSVTPRPAALAALVAVLLGTCGCAPNASHSANVENLTDELLAGIETYARGQNLTAIALPDVQQDFSAVLWIVTLSGQVNLTAGSLTDFQRVDRFGSSSLVFLEDTHNLILQTGIKIPELKGTYDFSAKAGVVSQRGKIKLSVSGLTATTMVHMYTDTLKPYMVELKINDLGRINVQVQDGVVGWLVTAVANVVSAFMRQTLKGTLEQQLPVAINELLDSLDIPAMIRPPADLCRN